MVTKRTGWFFAILLSVNAFAADLSAARYAIVCDPASELCWQDPQKDAYNMADPGLVGTEAARYCDELVLGGYDDWRLPDSNELRALIDGNPATQPGGQCALSIGGERNETLFRACEGSEPGNGPGDNNCYMQSWLSGTCNKPGPPTATQALEIWASNRPSDDADGWQAYVSFDRGALGYNHINSAGDVRCVRQLARSDVAESSGTSRDSNADSTDESVDSLPTESASATVVEQRELLPKNVFVVQDYEVAEIDPCEHSDKLVLNIRTPEKLAHTPDRLMVFFYRADKWRFPPAGPPDGGTDYNTVKNPEFSADGILTTVLPACTYYRESTLKGEYRVFVALMMEARRPPIVAKGDYYWGSNTEVFRMPLNGKSHRGAEQELDITLWPVVN